MSQLNHSNQNTKASDFAPRMDDTVEQIRVTNPQGKSKEMSILRDGTVVGVPVKREKFFEMMAANGFHVEIIRKYQ